MTSIMAAEADTEEEEEADTAEEEEEADTAEEEEAAAEEEESQRRALDLGSLTLQVRGRIAAAAVAAGIGGAGEAAWDCLRRTRSSTTSMSSDMAARIHSSFTITTTPPEI